MPTIEETLNERFGLPDFRPGQRQVIECLLSGRSALALFPTGGGKSLCYQLPALHLPGLTLVVSPLIALMKDQVDRLQARGIAAARLDSGLEPDAVRALYDQLQRGELKLLYVAPERLANERFIARLTACRLSLLAVDEAHCVSEWGHNFRPDYLKLARLAETLRVERVLALTATATPTVAEQIRASFRIDVGDQVSTGFYRPNLALYTKPQPLDGRAAVLAARLRAAKGAASIVYVTQQRTAEALAGALSEDGVPAAAYHAGLEADVRSEIQERFMAGQLSTVVATIAFGMGIDKADIRSVYHYNLPKSLENYMQEVGRAGRDGKPARCELLADRDDLIVLQNFTYGDTPERDALDGMLKWLWAQKAEFFLSEYTLAFTHDLRPLVVRTVLTYLELDGIIASTAPFYTEYKIAFKVDEAAVIAHFDAARADFLRALFAMGKKGRTWLTLQLGPDSMAADGERQRAVRALGYLEQQGMVELKPSGLMHGYRRLREAERGQALERLDMQFQQREQRDLERLQAVCDWITGSGCHAARLVAHFGEQLAQPCGQCSGCLGAGVQLSAPSMPPVDLSVVQSIVAEGHAALSTPRALARFLCGLSSPRSSRARLSKNRHFGAMAETPFSVVLAACGAVLGGVPAAI